MIARLFKTSHSPRSAVFLDRDGTLIEDIGYLRRPEDIVWFPDTFNALRRLTKHFLLFVVSNQSGIAAGLLSEAEVDRVNRHIDDALRAASIPIQRWYVCPHSREDECDCMKPAPRFLKEARRDFQVSLKTSFAIGDHPHDVTFIESQGGTGLYLLTGHGAKHRAELPEGTATCSTLSAAVDTILSTVGQYR